MGPRLTPAEGKLDKCSPPSAGEVHRSAVLSIPFVLYLFRTQKKGLMQNERKGSGCSRPFFLQEAEMSAIYWAHGRIDPLPPISPIIGIDGVYSLLFIKDYHQNLIALANLYLLNEQE